MMVIQFKKAAVEMEKSMVLKNIQGVKVVRTGNGLDSRWKRKGL